MSAVSRATSVMGSHPQFIPSQPQEILLVDFNAKFSKDRVLLVEDFQKVYEDSKPLVAPGVGDCIALLAVQINKGTQKVEFYAGYHMTVETGSEEVEDFIDCLDDQQRGLYLYLIGGNKGEDSSELLRTIQKSLKEKLKGAHVVSELFNLVGDPGAPEDIISVGLTKDGEVFWCYGDAD